MRYKRNVTVAKLAASIMTSLRSG